MFAFAIWDRRDAALLLARDRVGKKPLFYAQRDGDAQLRLGAAGAHGRPRRSRASSTRARSTATSRFGYIPAPLTRSGAASEAPAGAHARLARRPGVASSATGSSTTRRSATVDARELEEELRGLIGGAVRRRMIADVPLGAFLSGGVDSSIVVAEMAALSAEPVKTFSIGFDDAASTSSAGAR